MAWSKTLQDASWRGITFDVVSTQDGVDREVARHSQPYTDGVGTEDLGAGERRISLRAIFYGDDYEARFEKFKAALDVSGVGELVHPVFGSIKSAQLLRWNVAHQADEPDACQLDLEFIESATSAQIFSLSSSSQTGDVARVTVTAARSAGTKAFAKKLAAASAQPGFRARLDALRNVMTGTLRAMRSQVKGVTTTTLDVITYPQAFASDLVSLVAGMVDLRAFDSSTLLSDWNGLGDQLKSVVKLPGQTQSGSVRESSLSGVSALSGADTPIPAKETDVAAVTALLQLVAGEALVSKAADILAAQADSPALAPSDIERIANDSREAIQAAIDLWRDLYEPVDYRPVTEPAKDAAYQIQEAARMVIDLLPPLVRRSVPFDGNLHLLAHAWYADYTRADELLRLNPTLRNPNRIAKGDVLNAYAQ